MNTLVLRLLLLLILLFPWLLSAETPSLRPTICLNMIVKNESAVIERCLESVLPIIDYWVIVDTGSTDHTQEIIKTFMKTHKKAGELFERPWVNFGHNRNEALALAQGKADYIFFIDADDYLKYEPDFKLPLLDRDYYYMTILHAGSSYQRIFLIKSALDWQWKGVLHEVLVPQPSWSYATIDKVFNVNTQEGARSKDPLKYARDAELLELALKEAPNDPRTLFYLAQSYLDAKNYPKSLENYQKRVEVGGWDQEIFISLLHIAFIKELQEESIDDVINSYMRAFYMRNTRVEPLYHVSRLLREKNDFTSAYLAAKVALAIPRTTDILFVENWMYEYGLELELSISSYWIGNYAESYQLSADLLKKENLPPEIREQVQKNRQFAEEKVKSQVTIN